ncbi:MAG: DNA mismatch repair protein MutS [Alphaproteobacteria bacterium]|nr:DNA mismatch repair protein MutS [Alphaproteobacteria bacterium]
MDASTDNPAELKMAPPDGAATPMMAQYLRIKVKYPDALLLYRMGDFYELFFEDAEKASATLGIALTKRGKHQGADIPMCGVPVHAIDQYLQKLIRHGHRAAICEQVEDPAEAKKRGAKSVVARDVVRLITPGTLTEDSLLDAKARNYLAALAAFKASGEMALAYVDISSGELAVATTDEARLGADLARLSATEILVGAAVSDDPLIADALRFSGAAITDLASSRFDSVSGEHRLKQHFGVETLEAFGDFRRVDVAALGALIDYIAITQVGQMPYLRPPRREAAEAGLLIDAATRANLELTRSLNGERKGSLLACLSETVTAAGARAFADLLSRPLADATLINERLDMVSYFQGDERLCDRLRDALVAMPDLERALARITSGRGGPRDLAAVRDSIFACKTMLAVIHAQKTLLGEPDQLSLMLRQLGAAPLKLAEALQQALAVELPHLARDGGFIAPGYALELDENRKLRDDTRQVIAALQSQYAESSGVKALKIKHNNMLGYFIEVTAQQAELLKLSDADQRFIHRQTIASAVRFTTVELGELEQKIALAASRVLALELDFFKAFVDEIVALRAVLSSAAMALAMIDVFTSAAFLARNRRYVRPIVDQSLQFEIKAGRHPIVEEALRGKAERGFAANDCDLSDAHKKLWLLTGPNMAGKSTFLRQNALIAIIAQVGLFVPAQSAHIGVVDRLYSRVGAADDLARGRSTFMVEMIETAAILNQATPRSLVILDEIGRGTATYDGLSIAWATLEHLHDVNQCRGLFATHYHELTALTARLNQLYCATMKVKEWKGDLIFLNEVAAGSAERSYGIQAAKLAGMPTAVIQRAGEVLKRLEQGKGQGSKVTVLEELPLFSATAKVPASSAEPDVLRERLNTISPDEVSPREAHALIYELKDILLKLSPRS